MKLEISEELDKSEMFDKFDKFDKCMLISDFWGSVITSSQRFIVSILSFSINVCLLSFSFLLLSNTYIGGGTIHFFFPYKDVGTTYYISNS